MFTDIDIYLRDIAQYATPTEEDNQRWLVQGDVHRVIERNLRLVVKIAKRWEGRGLALDDLIQEGTLGLIEAVYSYDVIRGRLSTYLSWTIERFIRDALNRRYEVMKLPLWRVERVAKSRRMWSKQYPDKELASAPIALIADCLGTSENVARDICADMLEIERVDHVQSLMTPLTESEQETTLADILEADSAWQPEIVVLQEAEQHGVWEWLSALLPMERVVIVKRFGLEQDEEPWTQEATAHFLHMGVVRLRSLEERALLKLRRAAYLSQQWTQETSVA